MVPLLAAASACDRTVRNGFHDWLSWLWRGGWMHSAHDLNGRSASMSDLTARSEMNAYDNCRRLDHRGNGNQSCLGRVLRAYTVGALRYADLPHREFPGLCRAGIQAVREAGGTGCSAAKLLVLRLRVWLAARAAAFACAHRQQRPAEPRAAAGGVAPRLFQVHRLRPIERRILVRSQVHREGLSGL